MKNLKINIFTVLVALVSAASAHASGLMPRETYNCQGNVYDSIVCFSLYFPDCHIQIQEPTTINIYDGEDIVKQGPLTFKNHTSFLGTLDSEAQVNFTQPLGLPLGKTYKIVFPAGCIWKKDSSAVTIDELVYKFTLAKDFSADQREYKDGNFTQDIYGESFRELYGRYEKISRGRCFSFFYNHELTITSGAHGILMCGIDTVGTYPVTNGWGEVGEGYANIYFPTTYFEEGKEYKIFLPAGSVLLSGNQALGNKAEEITFMGGYDGVHDPAEPLMCYIDYGQGRDAIYEVKYQFDEEIAIAAETKIYLRHPDSGAFLDQAAATLEKGHDGLWYVKAEFGGYPITTTLAPRVFLPQDAVYKALSGHRDAAGDDLTSKAVTGRYDMLGRPVGPGHRGLTILKYTDGTARKIILP